jgi:excisionase family DNA binding protein
MPMDETYLTVREVADRLRVTRQAIYNWIAEGKLKAVKVGGKSVRITLTSVNDLIQPIAPGEPIEEVDESGQWAPALVAA